MYRRFPLLYLISNAPLISPVDLGIMFVQSSMLRARNGAFKALRPAATRSIHSSMYRLLDSSKRVNDGGPEDIPHHGINVDKSIRMDQ